jgi:hypothetical protein
MITVIVEHTSSEESLRKSIEMDDSLPLKSIINIMQRKTIHFERHHSLRPTYCNCRIEV